jgi:syntaxin 16
MKTLDGMSTPLDRASTPIMQNPYTDPSLMDSETDRSFSQSTLRQAQQHRLQNTYNNDTVIAHREREIEDIAQSIIDLANIFQEIQTMVIDQGTLLDRIDYNVEKMATEVKAADKELTVATGYQRKSLKRKAILLLIIIIAGMLILLGLKISSKKSGTSAQPMPIPVDEVSPNLPPPGLDRRRIDLAEAASGLHRRDWRRRRRRAPWELSATPFNSVS